MTVVIKLVLEKDEVNFTDCHAALNLRAALHDGEDPAEVVTKKINSICQPGRLG